MVELTIWEGELPGMLMSSEAEVDAETRLMSIVTSPWTKPPPTHTHTLFTIPWRRDGHYTVCLSCEETEMSTPAR